MLYDCLACGLNGSACSGCPATVQEPLTEAEIDEIERRYREMI